MTWMILIVDDEDEILDEMAEYLGYKGYRVERAADGIEALEIFGRLGVDLVITDLMMPRCDGFELISRLLAIDARLPIVAVAGTYSHDELARAGDLGARAVLRKPIKLRELADMLPGLLEPSAT